MTIVTTVASAGPFTGTGAPQTLPFTFQAASEGEIKVTVDGVAVTGYTVSLQSDRTGSVVGTFAVGAKIYIVSDPLFTQGANYDRFGPYFPDTLNPHLDRAAIRDIRLKDSVDRALVAPVGTSDPLTYFKSIGLKGADALPPETYREVGTTGQTVFPNTALYTDFRNVTTQRGNAGFNYDPASVLVKINGQELKPQDFTAPGGYGRITLARPLEGALEVSFTSYALGSGTSTMINTGKGLYNVLDYGGAVANPDNKVAIEAAMAAAAASKGMVTTGGVMLKTEGVTGNPRIGGLVNFAYTPKDAAVAAGLRFACEVGCYTDNRDAQTTRPADMLFENIICDGRSQPIQVLTVLNGKNIEINHLVGYNCNQPAGATAGAGLRNGNGTGIDISSYIGGSATAEDIRIAECHINGKPTGTPSAANYGIGIGINAGAEGVPFPYTGQDINGVTKTEVAISGLARAEAFYRQFGFSIPQPKQVLGLLVKNCVMEYCYYGYDVTGVNGYDLLDNVADFSIRSFDLSNGNVKGRLLRNKMLNYSSCGALLSYYLRDIELAGNLYRTNRVAGAAAILGLFGIYDLLIRNEDILLTRNTEAGNPDGVGGSVAKAGISLAVDIVRATINDVKIRGISGVGHIIVAPALVNSSAIAPSHYGINNGANLQLMAHGGSDVSISSATLAGASDNASPGIRVTQIDDTALGGSYAGSWALDAKVNGTKLENNNFSEPLRFEGMTAAKLTWSAEGNPFIAGATSSAINATKATMLKRSGNAGDEGIDKIPTYSFDAIGATFQVAPGIGIAKILDANTPFVYRDGGAGSAIRSFPAGAAVTIAPVYTAAVSINTTRAAGSNVIVRNGGTGVWAAGERGSTAYTLSSQVEQEAYHKAGTSYSMGVVVAGTISAGDGNGTLAQSTASMVAAVDGELISVVGGATNPFATSGFRVGDGEWWKCILAADGKSFTVVTGSGKTAVVPITATGGASPLGTAPTLYATRSIDIAQINQTYSGVKR